MWPPPPLPFPPSPLHSIVAPLQGLLRSTALSLLNSSIPLTSSSLTPQLVAVALPPLNFFFLLPAPSSTWYRFCAMSAVQRSTRQRVNRSSPVVPPVKSSPSQDVCPFPDPYQPNNSVAIAVINCSASQFYTSYHFYQSDPPAGMAVSNAPPSSSAHCTVSSFPLDAPPEPAGGLVDYTAFYQACMCWLEQKGLLNPAAFAPLIAQLYNAMSYANNSTNPDVVPGTIVVGSAIILEQQGPATSTSAFSCMACAVWPNPENQGPYTLWIGLTVLEAAFNNQGELPTDPPPDLTLQEAAGGGVQEGVGATGRKDAVGGQKRKRDVVLFSESSDEVDVGAPTASPIASYSVTNYVNAPLTFVHVGGSYHTSPLYGRYAFTPHQKAIKTTGKRHPILQLHCLGSVYRYHDSKEPHRKAFNPLPKYTDLLVGVVPQRQPTSSASASSPPAPTAFIDPNREIGMYAYTDIPGTQQPALVARFVRQFNEWDYTSSTHGEGGRDNTAEPMSGLRHEK